jgi:hypothetical protein
MFEKIRINNFLIYFSLTLISICAFHAFNLMLISQLSGVAYAPINLSTGFIPNDELVIYGARISEALEGSVLLSDSYTFEHQGSFPYLAPFLAENIAAVFLWATSNNVAYSQLLLDLVFPGLIFIMIYRMLLLLSVSAFFSAFFSSLIIIFYDLFSVVMSNPNALATIKIFPFEQHLLTRSVLAICIFFGLMAVNRTIIFHKDASQKNFLFAILSNAILIYFNIFIFIFVTLFNLFSLVFSHQLVNWRFLKKHSLAFLLFFVIISFYFINQYYLFGNPEAYEIIDRAGMARIRGISLLSLVYLFFLILTLYFKSHIPKICFIVLCSALGSLLISKNLQMVIGFNPQIFHYDRDIGRWILLISGFALIYTILKNRSLLNFKPKLKIVSAILILFVLISQFNFASKNYLKYTIKNSYIELFYFLNNFTLPDSVIVADLDLSKWIASFTHNNTFIAISPASMVSDNEAIQRFIDGYKILGFSDAEILDLARREEVYIDLFHLSNGYVMSSFPMENLQVKKARATKRFATLIKASIDSTNTKNFLFDYALLNKNKRDDLYNQNSSTSILFENDDFVLMAIKK